MLCPINPENEDNPSAWNQWILFHCSHDITNQEYLPFRALINCYQTKQILSGKKLHMGRADNVMVYEGFTRKEFGYYFDRNECRRVASNVATNKLFNRIN